MHLDPFTISMFILGAVGSMWTTVYTLFEFCLERMEEYNSTINNIVFQDVFYSFIVPRMEDKLMHWDPNRVDDACDLYVSARLSVLLTDEEYSEFIRLCTDSGLFERPWWVPRRYARALIQDLASQYVWNVSSIPLFRMMEHLQN